MSAKKKVSSKKKSASKKKAEKKKAPSKRTTSSKKASSAKKSAEPTFPEAFAAFLRKRKIRVPAGLKDAPPAAYANQPASVVERLEGLSDEELVEQAKRVASYAKKQQQRLRKSWDESPLIKELRRRKLDEPERPTRVVGAAFSFKKPLREWSDAEVLDAARQWSERGRD